jgi:hypothetical protein
LNKNQEKDENPCALVYLFFFFSFCVCSIKRERLKGEKEAFFRERKLVEREVGKNVCVCIVFINEEEEEGRQDGRSKY